MCVFVTRNVWPHISSRVRAVVAAKTQTVEKLQEIMPFYYYHFRSSFTYKTYIRVSRVTAYVIYPLFFFIPLGFSPGFYDDDPFIVYIRGISFGNAFENSRNRCRILSAIRIPLKNAENIRVLRQRKRFFAMTNWCNANYRIVPNFGNYRQPFQRFIPVRFNFHDNRRRHEGASVILSYFARVLLSLF